MDEPKNLIWASAVLIITTSICWVVIFGLSHPFIFRIEMDNNTMEAIKSMSKVYESQDNFNCSSFCVYQWAKPQNYSNYSSTIQNISISHVYYMNRSIYLKDMNNTNLTFYPPTNYSYFGKQVSDYLHNMCGNLTLIRVPCDCYKWGCALACYECRESAPTFDELLDWVGLQ